jgi:predicted N-acyltransferase
MHMSINQKLRTLARVMPYYPRTNSKGEFVISYEFIMGSEMLKKDPHSKDKDGKPIKATTRYRQPIVLCADHFEELKKAYQLNGEEGVRAYNEKVKEYHAKKSRPDQQPNFKKV